VPACPCYSTHDIVEVLEGLECTVEVTVLGTSPEGPTIVVAAVRAPPTITTYEVRADYGTHPPQYECTSLCDSCTGTLPVPGPIVYAACQASLHQAAAALGCRPPMRAR
jgi:hypothetical protein